MDKTLLKNDSKIHKEEGERGKKIGLHKNLKLLGNSLEIQWLGFHASTPEGSGLIPGWGTKIPQAGVAAPKHKSQRLHGKAPHTKKDKRQAMAKHHTQRRTSGRRWQSTTHKEGQAAGDGKAPHTKKDKY